MVGPVADSALLAAAGVVGGAASSAGAIGSLISYPALLAVGVPPLAANVTNAVAVVGIGLGSTARSRPELRGTLPRAAWWAATMCVGAAAGAGLLLSTSEGVFSWLVPFLIAAAAVLMLGQPRLSAWRRTRARGSGGSVFAVALFAVAVYDGYFGAASGIMTLALLMVTVETQLLRANALKNVLLGVADVVVALAFIAFGPVRWSAALFLGLGFLVGGALGPSVARRIPADTLRIGIGCLGLGLAAWLLIAAVRG